jgi:hypothetical protein
VAVTLFFLRDPVQFVGDFSLRAGFLARDLPTERLFPQAFPLDVAVNASLPRALMQFGFSPTTALQVVGCATAFLFTWAGIAFVRAAGARQSALPAAALLVLGGGWLVHFAGYNKFGPLLLGWMVAGAGFALMANRGKGLLVFVTGVAVCLLSHRAGFLIVPIAALVLAWAWTSATNLRARSPIAVAAVLLAILALSMAGRAWNLLFGVDFATHLAMPGAAAHASPWLLRITDAVNALFFVTPLWPVGIAAYGMIASGPHRAALSRIVLAALAIQSASLIFVTSTQGNVRDWDVSTTAGMIFGLATAYALAWLWSRGRARGALAPATTVTIATAIALWACALVEPLQLKRIETHLRAQPGWTDAQKAHALDFLGIYSLNRGRFDDAARHFESAAGVAPNPRYLYQASLAFLGAGRFDDAANSAWRVVRANPARGAPWWVLAKIATASGDSTAAAAYADSARARGSLSPPPEL